MKLLWMSDLHLNFLDPIPISKFITSLSEYNSDGLVITGDIATGNFIHEYLEAFLSLDVPVYFVLGNHDFYHSSVQFVSEHVSEISEDNPNLIYLTNRTKPIQLTDDTVLVGVDGWADGRFGNWKKSEVQLNDFTKISDFLMMSKNDRLKKMQELAKTYADILDHQLNQIGDVKNVIIATHVSPFQKSCIHMGNVSGEDWLPLFSSKVLGEVIIQHTILNPNTNFYVLCGHTHSEGVVQLGDKLWVYIASAEYYHPKVYKVIEIGGESITWK